MNQAVLAQSEELAKRLGDLDGIRFYAMAIRRLGYGYCYELASEVIVRAREGKIRTTQARYFNRSVMNEIVLREQK